MRTMNLRKAPYACARALCAALALFALLLGASARGESDGLLRVKLTRLGSPGKIEMRADCEYRLADDGETRIPAGTTMTVTARDGALSLRYGKQTVDLGASAELIRDGDGHSGVTFSSPSLSNRFCGDLCLTASGDAITTVLRIYVEDYLHGVVGHEMAPSSGLEALKAQAVVSRNYALRQKASRSASAYDLTDAGDALSFRGYSAASEYAASVRAVDETRGQVLYYKGSPATCYFCDSNGGQTESSANALGESLPYSSVRDDPYDLESTGAKKTATLRADATGLAAELRAALIDDMSSQLEDQGFGADHSSVQITAIEGIDLESPRYAAPSRLYKVLAFHLTVSGRSLLGERLTAHVTARVPTYGGIEKWYGLGINEADNETVWVSRADRAFEITFRRSGSGLGMSQRGAQVMARKGFSCETILDYYYPGASLRRLELSSGSAGARAELPNVDPIATARLGQKRKLYAGADDASSVLTTLPAGATVDVYAVEGDWAAVGSGGMVGFIHTDAFSSFVIAGETAVQAEDDTLARVGGGGTDVLQLPVKTAKSLANLSGGVVARLIAYTDAWALVATEDGVQGFVPRGKLSLVIPEGDDADDEGEAETEEIEGGEITLVEGRAYRYVDADALPMYERWSTDSKVLATLERGDRVRLGAYNSKWACVRANGRTGFVLVSGLTEEKPAPAIEGGEITVIDGKCFAIVKSNDAPMYPSWSTDDAPVMRLEADTRVQVGAYNSKWACVRADGVTGFMLVSALKVEE